MFLLDTNVVSELRKARAGRADKNVVAWAAGASAASMFVSVITVQELEIGVLLAERRDPPKGVILRRWLEEQVLPAFGERLIPVDTAVARRGVPTPRYRDRSVYHRFDSRRVLRGRAGGHRRITATARIITCWPNWSG